MRSIAANSSSGFIIMEIIMALVVLGFIVHPVFVQGEDQNGRHTTKIQWEMPMAQLFAQLGDIGGLIDRSWVGLDRQFGYNGAGTGARAVELMTKSLQNGIVLMTAGFIDKRGHVTADFQQNAVNFEDASKGLITAYYNTAREGMVS